MQNPKALEIRFITMRSGSLDEVERLADEFETLVVMPFIDAATAHKTTSQLAGRAGVHGLLLAVEDSDRQGFISIMNQVYRRTQSKRVAYVAQDAYAGRQWLLRAVEALDKTSKGLFGFNDGKWMGSLAAFGVVSRAWANQNYAGDLFHAGYQQHYADVELTILAMSSGQYCYDPNAVLVEVDWDKDRTPVNAMDKALYRNRAKAKLDGRVQNQILLNAFS